MLTVEKTDDKEWTISNEKDSIVLTFGLSSITNKFFIVSEFLINMSKILGTTFDNWLFNFLSSYVNEKDNRFAILETNVPHIKKYVDEYIEKRQLNFSKFVDETKIKKSSIFFNEEEIKKIIQLSNYLKVYSLIFNSPNLKLDNKRHKKIYTLLANDVDSDIIYKIFTIVKTKTYRYKLSDQYMWDYIQKIQCRSIDNHVTEIFNFIMNSILILCQEDKNPITYFVIVVDESINWFLRSVYKGSIIYEDSISTENIHGVNVNNIDTYSYNDTLGRIKGVAYGRIYDQIEKTSMISESNGLMVDSLITNFQKRVTSIKYISPITECLAFPILSKITKIPFVHFQTIPPDHAAVLSVYVHSLLQKVFLTEFSNLFMLLDYYPLIEPAVTTTYKLKAYKKHINVNNKVDNFFDFRTKILAERILAHYIGRVSKSNLINTVTGDKLYGVSIGKIEDDGVLFYSMFYSSNSKVDTHIENLREIMKKDF